MWIVESDSLSPEKNHPLLRRVQKSSTCSSQKILLWSGVLKFECHSFARIEISLRRLQQHSRKCMTAALTGRFPSFRSPGSQKLYSNLFTIHSLFRAPKEPPKRLLKKSPTISEKCVSRDVFRIWAISGTKRVQIGKLLIGGVT